MKKHRFWAWAMIGCLFMTLYTGYKHKEWCKGLCEKVSHIAVLFARHGRALTGASPEHAQIVGSV